MQSYRNGGGSPTPEGTESIPPTDSPPEALDARMVRVAYRLLVGTGKDEGTVTEIRVLGARERTGSSYSADYFGYFDNSADIVHALSRFSAWSGVYFVPNEVEPSLIARSKNKLRRAEKGLGTTDGQIIRRRWLLLDIDWQRPAGISTTDDEHKAALALTNDIAVRMTVEYDWPMPIRADSGNGAHALWRIDLPADSDQVGKVLAALERKFGTGKLKVDQTVKNAARIWKLYGTLACKGDHTSERPHRMSKIVRVPKQVSILTEDTIHRFLDDDGPESGPEPRVGKLPTDPEPSRTPSITFDAKALMESKGIEFDDAKRASGYTVHPMAACPCDRKEKGAALTIADSGAVGLKCLHASCEYGGGQKPGDAWRKWRRANDPTYGSTDHDGAWAAPVPFGTPGGLPVFPSSSLPTWLREMVEAVAVATQTPVDLPAMVGLGALALSVARKVEVRVRDGYVEPVNLYCLTVLPPAERKSAVLQTMVAPVEQHEKAMVAAARPLVAAAEARRRIAEGARDKAQAVAAKATDEKERTKLTLDAAALAADAANAEVPPIPRLMTDDATPEALARLLAEQGGRLGVVSAEGGVFDLLSGRYSQTGGPNLDAFLKGHSGDALRVDRIGRPPEFVTRPALTVVLTVQPDVLHSIASRPGFRGRGLLGRFLYSLPTSRLGSRTITPPSVPREVAHRYRGALLSLLSLPAPVEPHALRLSKDAEVAWVAYATDIEPQLAEGGELAAIRDWAGKHCGAVARIAGLLHLAEGAGEAAPWETPVSGTAMANAIRIGRYLVEHAVVAFGAMGSDPAVEGANAILGWMRRTRPSSVTKRDIHRALHTRFVRSSDIDGPLALLVDRGFLRPRAQEPTGGRPASPSFAVNPLGLAEADGCPDSRADVMAEVLASTAMAAGDNSDVSDESPSVARALEPSVTSVTSVTGGAASAVAPLEAVAAPSDLPASPSSVGSMMPAVSLMDGAVKPENPPWPPPSWINGVPPWEVVGSPEWKEKEAELERLGERLFG